MPANRKPERHVHIHKDCVSFESKDLVTICRGAHHEALSRVLKGPTSIHDLRETYGGRVDWHDEFALPKQLFNMYCETSRIQEVILNGTPAYATRELPAPEVDPLFFEDIIIEDGVTYLGPDMTEHPFRRPKTDVLKYLISNAKTPIYQSEIKELIGASGLTDKQIYDMMRHMMHSVNTKCERATMSRGGDSTTAYYILKNTQDNTPQ